MNNFIEKAMSMYMRNAWYGRSFQNIESMFENATGLHKDDGD